MSIVGVVVLAMAITVALALGVLVGAVLTGYGDKELDLLRARLMTEQRVEHLTRSALQAMRRAAKR